MVVHLTAVDDDGSDRSLEVPADPRRPIAVARGEDLTLDVALVNPDGRPVELSLPTDALRFIIRDRDGAVVMADATAVVGDPGRYQVTVAGSAIVELGLPRYAWELWMRKGGRRAQVVGSAEFILMAGAPEGATL